MEAIDTKQQADAKHLEQRSEGPLSSEHDLGSATPAPIDRGATEINPTPSLRHTYTTSLTTCHGSPFSRSYLLIRCFGNSGPSFVDSTTLYSWSLLMSLTI